MSTLLDFATTALGSAKQDATSAQSTIAATQQAIASNQTQRDANANAIARAQQDVTTARAALANAAMPADATAAAAQLQTALAELNTAQGQAVDLQAQLDELNGGLAVQIAALGAATTELNAAQTSYATAQQGDQAHQTWHAAITGALSSISGAAGDTESGTLFADAKQNAEAGFDPTLLAYVRLRESNEQNRQQAIQSTLDDMQDDVDAKMKADGGLAGAVAPLQTVYDRAEAAFRDAVTGAQDRFNRALGLLATVANGPQLTDAEQTAMTDATTVNAAKGAVANEEAVETTQDALTAAQAAVDRAQAQTDAGWDPPPDLTTPAADLATATTDAQDAQAAFTQANQQALAAWVATVSGARWSLLAAFDEAKLILDDLIANATASQLGALEWAMTNAAGTLVTALTAQSESVRAIAALQERVDLQAAALDAAERNGSAQVLNALSGNA